MCMCWNDTLSQVEEEDNDTVESANSLTMTEPDATDDSYFYYGRANGVLTENDKPTASGSPPWRLGAT